MAMLHLLLPLAFAAATPASPDYDGNCQSPRWSADGSLLSWEVNYHDRKIVEQYVLPYGAGTPPKKVVPLTRGTSSITSGFDVTSTQQVVHELTFAPPGSRWKYAYTASGTTEDYDLYVDGIGPVAVAPGADGNAAWSPDGRNIAFTSARTGQGDLYLLPLAALDKPPLKLSGDPVASELYVAWSPDSSKLVFVGHTQQGDNLYLIDNLQFPAPRAFTSWEHTQTRPSFSPDGTMVAFYSNHTDIRRFDLYFAPLNGTPTLVATDVVMSANGPSWTPDGRHLVYVKHDENRFNPVYAAPIRQPSQATALPTGTVGNGDLAVTRRADGSTWLAVAAQGLAGDKVRDFRRVYTMALTSLP